MQGSEGSDVEVLPDSGIYSIDILDRLGQAGASRQFFRNGKNLDDFHHQKVPIVTGVTIP